MGYNVADIIEKAINIAKKRKTLYKNIENKKDSILGIKIISRVLIKEVDRTIEYYEELLKEAGNMNSEDIDFSIYDKISFLINEFNGRINRVEINTVQDYLSFSLGMEKSLYSLLIDIQGRLVKTLNDTQTNTYKILSEIIKNKADHILRLEKSFDKE